MLRIQSDTHWPQGQAGRWPPLARPAPSGGHPEPVQQWEYRDG